MMNLSDYCNTIPNFALYLKYAKTERYLYELIVKSNKEDLYQIISECAITCNSDKEVNRMLKQKMYYFASRILDYRKVKEIKNSKKVYYKAKTSHTCDLCKKTSYHYHYKSFIPDKLVCRLCYNKLKRQDIARNKKQKL